MPVKASEAEKKDDRSLVFGQNSPHLPEQCIPHWGGVPLFPLHLI